MAGRIPSSRVVAVGAILFAVVVLAVTIGPSALSSAQGDSSSWQVIAEERGLTEADLRAAAMTYTPSGVMDPYVMVASGGHSGQVFIIGMPSMRLLRSVAVFTPEPWQGYGYGAGEEVLAGGDMNGRQVRWGDTHHPALSETNGDYDGQWAFINDKANARVAVIDLRDFETKQIVNNPLFLNDHGGTFVTPNTEYIIEGGQYGQPLGSEYAPLAEYETAYRGMITFWKFDREAGRIDPSQSFAMELPPYWQDLCDSGKLVSDGWVFCNSINTELATGGIEKGNPPFEAGVSRNTTDFLHIINLKAAEAVYKAGSTVEIAGMQVITLDTVIENDLLFFTPEPRSPHGVDIAPGGDYIVVSGKLDPHVTVYSFQKILDTIAAGTTETDQYGVPILPYESVLEAQVEVGLGPLHTQFGPDGYAYTSLFLDSAVARWSIGAEGYRPQDGWSLISKVPIQYNVGHIAAAEGDTVSPDGQFLVALNKWSVDRFLNTGPLLPQNFQLIDIGQEGDTLQVLYDMPFGVGEPHYAQIIKADKLAAWEVYPEVGWNPLTQSPDPNSVAQGTEGVTREGNEVTVRMTAVRSHFTPEHVEIKAGDKVKWTITNVERARDATHGFSIPYYGINLSIEPGETVTFEFEATEPGVFSWYCTEFCSALHLEMMGYLTIEPE
ncbi:MAG: Sec-dependent nitrous-oxide reductase [Chloroflexi bacterium]|nr:Nitrous-oxide reductase [Anaerolineae bacterium]MCC6567427.1 Sec-dependent nitrous-oxide reductase [Chloroflexota bacterium]OQY80329.1 MAG: cytochrome C [Anaerolineae bacterium UTCFX5]MBW7879430.1 Sec-dependent nitrous-oxide reductase [Anaerolineae bacterium]MCO6443383.1 Sec-dependent nitrous-oxide reductase [Anaerolineae bacterium]